MRTCMELFKKAKLELDARFRRISEAPEGFGLFKAIHDLVEYIDLNPALSNSLFGTSTGARSSRKARVPEKYSYLWQIYQGLEDSGIKTNEDIGHVRLVNVRDLNRIQNNELSENNFFWKKRELFRKLAVEIHEKLKKD